MNYEFLIKEGKLRFPFIKREKAKLFSTIIKNSKLKIVPFGDESSLKTAYMKKRKSRNDFIRDKRDDYGRVSLA